MLKFCLGPVKVYNEERLIHHHNGSEITLRYDFNQGCSARARSWQNEPEPSPEYIAKAERRSKKFVA